jgi:hypothetical protein
MSIRPDNVSESMEKLLSDFVFTNSSLNNHPKRLNMADRKDLLCKYVGKPFILRKPKF